MRLPSDRNDRALLGAAGILLALGLVRWHRDRRSSADPSDLMTSTAHAAVTANYEGRFAARA